MHRSTIVTEQDVRQAWVAMHPAFRSTHPLPQERTRQAWRNWSAEVRRDCNAVIVTMLDTATADLARGDHECSRIAQAEARPFQRLKRVLEDVEMQQGSA